MSKRELCKSRLKEINLNIKTTNIDQIKKTRRKKNKNHVASRITSRCKTKRKSKQHRNISFSCRLLIICLSQSARMLRRRFIIAVTLMLTISFRQKIRLVKKKPRKANYISSFIYTVSDITLDYA